MPVPALPYEDAPTSAVEAGVAVPWTRTYLDPQLRPYTGRVTAKRLDPPYLSTDADLSADGVAFLALEPGRYSIGAMLRDVNNTRAYQAEEITVSLPTEEDS